jgi:hypothetical protein
VTDFWVFLHNAVCKLLQTRTVCVHIKLDGLQPRFRELRQPIFSPSNGNNAGFTWQFGQCKSEGTSDAGCRARNEDAFAIVDGRHVKLSNEVENTALGDLLFKAPEWRRPSIYATLSALACVSSQRASLDKPWQELELSSPPLK